ncbi:hypothetical protein [Pseudomonas chlororaphis]|uniref:hypothetical protein n=1 Tax=Pseudomonas chlororaphis TaxID=587753 RepID=UPI00131A5C34|nr:hypothetical protein [Pseudomonas chlororaphis]WMJ01990.1 hypothetical protein RBU55_10700 [Pseudomonas chlororaphis subsp. aurantiaca]
MASGVVAALIGWLKDWLLKSRDQARNANFAAIGVIAKLDLYALHSRSNVWGYHEETAGLDPQAHYQNWPSCSYPELTIADDELRHLDVEHASDLAWLTTEKALASQHLRVIYEASFDPTEVHRHQAEVVGYFGYEAYLLASKLRKKYGLSSFGQRWGVDDDFSDLERAWLRTKSEVAKRARPITEDDL